MAGSARGFPVTLESWGWSQKGDIRPENQDSFLSWNERLLWAVADGVGSSAHGGEAGRLVTRMLLTTPHAASLDEHVNNVGGILRQGNDILRAHGGATQAASTVVALLMHGGEAACLWAGDSRCYLLRDGVLYQCTREHTLRQEKIDNGELTAPTPWARATPCAWTKSAFPCGAAINFCSVPTVCPTFWARTLWRRAWQELPPGRRRKTWPVPWTACPSRTTSLWWRFSFPR